MVIPLFFLLTLAGCCLLYLSHRHQGWLREPLSAMPARAAGVLSLTLALACGLAQFSAITAIFAWLALTMLVFSLLPYLSLLRAREGK